jgi:hypothetical protein
MDAIWIGLRKDNNKFEWNDGTEFSFSDWVDKNPSNKIGSNCVEVEPEDSLAGKWVNKPCNRKNLVICQKMQKLSLSGIQNILLNMKKKLSDTQEKLNENEKKTLRLAEESFSSHRFHLFSNS